MTLEQILDELARYGQIRLNTFDDDTWCCICKLNIKAKGSDFEIKSNMDHPIHIAAANECLDRVQAVLRDIHKMAIATPLEHQHTALEQIK